MKFVAIVLGALVVATSTVAVARTAKVPASPTPASPLKKDTKTAGDIARVLKSVTIYGSTFVPEVHCNPGTVDNPDQLEVFEVPGRDMTVVLCPGVLDGDENVVSVFSKTQAPMITRIRPEPSSGRITDEKIIELLSKAEARPSPTPGETQDYHRIPATDFDNCLRAGKKQHPGHYVGESFSKSTTNRGMFEAMTMYACVDGDRVLFNPHNRVQLVYSSVKVGWLNAACAKGKKTIDIPDVVPQPQATHVMVVKCSLLNALLNPVAK